jgi:hypothetical protein
MKAKSKAELTDFGERTLAAVCWHRVGYRAFQSPLLLLVNDSVPINY